ncbi:MAG: FAD-binding protein, partial [Sphaerochaetaceae bacterium]|nr:FAD-binding protein [Sphaerochaetaceae bacterium]
MESVNIIGAGLAGLSAAITLARANIPSNLISLQMSERAQSVMAEGGINGVLDTMGENDVVDNHFEDTIKAGVFLADRAAVRGLVSKAPEIIRFLSGLGVPFNQKDGVIQQRNFGGQKKKRTAYSKSSTGKQIMSALISECLKYEAKGLVTRYPRHDFVEAIIKDGLCLGVSIADIYTNDVTNLSGPVIMATGGMNGLFPGMTTGSNLNSADATAKLFMQGIKLGNLEMIQYHPTTMKLAGKRGLVSEAARGEGGRLFVMRGGQKWYFMEEKYPELKNLMPRDVVARESYLVTHSPECENQVYLDMTGIPEEIWEKNLPDLREEIIHYQKLDPKKEYIPVSPGIHYFMGG